MFRFLVAFAKRDGAQGLLEYALIVALIAITCFATMVAFGQHLQNNTYGLSSEVGQWNT